MRYMKFGMIAIVFSLVAISLYGQDVVVKIKPYDGTPATFVNAQIVADTVASGGLLATHVYEFARDQVYLHNAIFTVPNGKTLRLRAAEGAGKKPVIYLWETGTGSTPTRPPGNFVVLNGGNLEIKNICIAGFYEPEPDRVDGVQSGFIQTNAVGSSIILDGVILSNANGNHVRTNQNTVKVQITNSIFANMGALTTSNLGAGKGIDLRAASCDSFIIVNNTFVNYQDRVIRHYNFSDPTAGTDEIKYGRIEHNTFVNGMGFHGLLSLGNVGPEIIITNNLFVDAFALGEDSTDAVRIAEWANTGEYYPNGSNRITWIFTAPNNVTQWKVSNNYYAIIDSGWAFLNDFGFGVGSPLSWHINSRLGADSVNAFTHTNLSLTKIPRLMTNMMRWYEDPNGGNKTKNTPSDKFVVARDDYDRRPIEFYRDTLDCTYPTASAAYRGAEGGYPVGDLNWFPYQKELWEQGAIVLPPFIYLCVERCDITQNPNTQSPNAPPILTIRLKVCNETDKPLKNVALELKQHDIEVCGNSSTKFSTNDPSNPMEYVVYDTIGPHTCAPPLSTDSCASEDFKFNVIKWPGKNSFVHFYVGYYSSDTTGAFSSPCHTTDDASITFDKQKFPFCLYVMSVTKVKSYTKKVFTGYIAAGIVTAVAGWLLYDKFR